MHVNICEYTHSKIQERKGELKRKHSLVVAPIIYRGFIREKCESDEKYDEFIKIQQMNVELNKK